jgi:predicted phage gp36 major capsid-like protein
MSALGDRLREQVQTMSARDRKLALGLVVGLVLVALGGATYGLHAMLVDQSTRVEAAVGNLRDARDLAAQYAALRGKIDAAETKMASFRPNQLGTYLETWAKDAGVHEGLRAPSESGSQSVGAYKEREYRVELQEVTLEGATRLLHAIESSPYPVLVRSAAWAGVNAKDGPRKINLRLQVVTFARDEETK